MSSTVNLAVLQSRFLEGLDDTRQRLQSMFEQLAAQRENHELAQRLRIEIRALIGAGGTFGIALLSEQARTVDVWLGAATGASGIGRRKVFERLQIAMDELLDLLGDQHTPAALMMPAGRRREDIGVYAMIIDSSNDLRQQLSGYLKHYGFEVTALSIAEFSPDQLNVLEPTILFADVAVLEPFADALAAYAQSPAGMSCAYIFTAAEDSFAARMQAVRAGGVAFFEKPVDVFRLVDAIDSASRPHNDDIWRVLIADESPTLAEFSQTLLGEYGIETQRVTDPLALLDAVNDFQPDVLVMDVHMRDHSGIDLAQMVRQRGELTDLPVVFLSVNPDLDVSLLGITENDDDFLPKPIVPNQLLKSVRARCHRSRLRRGAGSRDQLTGLLQHSDFCEQLERRVARASREASVFSLCMIDIDGLSRINEEHGHRNGDKVLRTLSLMLCHRIRKREIGGRFGGDEIAIILPDCGPSRARLIIDELRQSFSRVLYQFDEQWVSLSFSAGIRGYEEGISASELLEQAATTQAEASAAGGDHVRVHGHR